MKYLRIFPRMCERRIRLACYTCDRTDGDGLTRRELIQKKTQGWRNIKRVQTYEGSIRQIDPHEIRKIGNRGWTEPSVLDWYTHVGDCPNCTGEQRDGS